MIEAVGGYGTMKTVCSLAIAFVAICLIYRSDISMEEKKIENVYEEVHPVPSWVKKLVTIVK